MSRSFSLREWLTQRHKDLGLVQKQVAAALQVSESTYASYVVGRRPISVAVAQKLIAVLQISPHQQAGFLDLATGRIATIAEQDLRLPAPNYPGQLPFSPNPFFGRQADLAHLHELFLAKKARLVTLVGPPGVGKTRLAAEAALRIHANLQGGVCFVDLSAVQTSDALAPAIAQALGLAEDKAKPATQLIREFVQPQDLLLLLDNFEHLLSAAPLVGDWVAACPGLRVLATSRAKLGLRAERVVALAPLPLPELTQPLTPSRLNDAPATAFFIDRATAQRTHFAADLDDVQATQIAQICTRLDGLPLAIELAAAHCDTLSVAALLNHLENGRPLPLASLQDLDPRQRTLQATIAWSVDRLRPDAQQAFANLGVFVGGFDGTTACALGVSDEALRNLHAHNLIQKIHSSDEAAPARFRLLETLREFALAQLGTRGHTEATQRTHAQHFARHIQTMAASPIATNTTPVLQAIHADCDNYRAALAWLLAHHTEAGQAAAALSTATGLFHYWLQRGLYREGLSWIERALACVDEGENTSHVDLNMLATANVRAGFLASQIGQPRCMDQFKRALQLYEQANNPGGMSRVLASLGMMARYPGNRAIAESYLTRALALARQTSSLADQVTPLGQLISLHFEIVGDYAAAENYATELRSIAHQLGVTRNFFITAPAQGMAQLKQGKLRQAEATFNEVLLNKAARADPVALAGAHMGMAQLHEQRGNLAAAVPLLQQAIAAYREQGLTFSVYEALWHLGRIALKQSDASTATSYFEEGLRIGLESFGIEAIANCLSGLACIEANQQASPEHAARQLSAALTIEVVFSLKADADRTLFVGQTTLTCARKLGKSRFDEIVHTTAEVIQANIPKVTFDSAHEAMAVISLPQILALAFNPAPASPSL